MIIQKKFIFKEIFAKSKNDGDIDIKKSILSKYDNEVLNLDFNTVRCPKCKNIGNYVVKGYYNRTIILNNIPIRIRILRIKCRECGKTHAVLFLDFVPYYQLSAIDAENLYRNDFKEQSNCYDYDLIKNLKKRYQKFIKRIVLFGISIKDTIEGITTKYVNYRNNSYLQIHRGFVLLNHSVNGIIEV